jgi:hypothetical protein
VRSVRTWPHQLHQVWVDRQAGFSIPIVLIPVSILSVILGEEVSKAFTNVGGGTIVRILGIAMGVGGVVTLMGIWRNDALYEIIGLVLTALGCAIYVVGALLGLGMLGLLAAAGHLCVILTLMGRVYQILIASRVREQLDKRAR